MWVLGTQYSWNFTTGGLWPWGLLPTILLSATFAIFVQSCHALLSRNLLVVVVVLVLLIPASDNTVAYSKKNQYGTYFPLLIEKWQVMLQVHLTSSSWLFQQVRTEERTKQWWNFLYFGCCWALCWFTVHFGSTSSQARGELALIFPHFSAAWKIMAC